jgi:hypothetical protein
MIRKNERGYWKMDFFFMVSYFVLVFGITFFNAFYLISAVISVCCCYHRGEKKVRQQYNIFLLFYRQWYYGGGSVAERLHQQ